MQAARKAFGRLVAAARRRARPSTCSGSPGSSRSAPASWRCSSRWTTASRSASRATSTCRWSRAHFFYYAGWADKLDYAGYGAEARPLGVAEPGHPWNFPLLMLAWKIAPALACGNTVVLKPAETTPLTALLFAEICRQAGLPPGVVNIVTGAGATGAAAGRPPRRGQGRLHRLDRGRHGRSRASVAGTGKKRDAGAGRQGRQHRLRRRAPIDQAVEGIVNGIFFNQGHVCCAGSRLLVQESIAETRCSTSLKRRLAHAAGRRPAGQEHRHRRDQLRRAAGPDHAQLVAGGRGGGRRALVARRARCPSTGYWFAADGLHRASRRRTGSRARRSSARSCRCSPSARPAEAVEKANNTPYGLSAGVWTEKGSRILWMATKLRAGVVWANTFNKFDPTSPFGGYKESGFGREGGRHGLEAYLKEIS